MRFLRRVLNMLVVLLFVSLMMFVLVRVLPGDPVGAALGDGATAEQIEKFRVQMGMDRPIHVQYVAYLRGLLDGHFGVSLMEPRDVGTIVWERLPATLELVICSLALAILIGVPLGILAATHRNGPVDQASRLWSLTGVSFPNFWAALMLQLLLGASLALLPITGRLTGPPPTHITGLYLVDSLLTGNGQAFWDAFVHLVAPTIVLAVGPLAQITSMIRSSMLDELGKPYVGYSSAVGMPRFLIDYKYALRNAFSSTLTLIGFLFPLMIGGAFVVEKVFAWPGIARFGADAILANDYNAIVGVTLVICLFVVIVNFVTEELYVALDPRIRLER
ncbi:ABC transporter permease [Reyranella sp.]|uniref:ABC transporter permease n=1 Tax=Reyranella sp. TaxID=1929291 RepID=UPI003BA84760